MFSFNQAAGFYCEERLDMDIHLFCFFSQNQQGDVLRLSVNGREVTMAAKLVTGDLSSFLSFNVFQYFTKIRVCVCVGGVVY